MKISLYDFEEKFVLAIMTHFSLKINIWKHMPFLDLGNACDVLSFNLPRGERSFGRLEFLCEIVSGSTGL